MSVFGKDIDQETKIKEGLLKNAETRWQYETREAWEGCRCGHPGAGCYCQPTRERTGRRRLVVTSKWKGEWE